MFLIVLTRYPQDGHAKKDSIKVWLNAPVQTQGDAFCGRALKEKIEKTQYMTVLKHLPNETAFLLWQYVDT